MSVFKDTRALASAVVNMVDAIMKGEEPEINDTESYDNGTGVIPTYLCDPVSNSAARKRDRLSPTPEAGRTRHGWQCIISLHPCRNSIMALKILNYRATLP